MIKVLWIFLIFALTSNTKGFASAIELSLSITAFPISDCHSVHDTESRLQSIEYYSSTQNIFSVIPLQIRGTKGRYDYSVIPTNVGIQWYSPLTRGARGVFFNYHFSQFPFEKGVSRRETQARLGSRDGVFLTSSQNIASRIRSTHPAKKLSPFGSAIAVAGSSSLTFNCVSVDSIQPFQVSSNILSDIFIPPK